MRKGELQPHHCPFPTKWIVTHLQQNIFLSLLRTMKIHSCSSIVAFFCGEFDICCKGVILITIKCKFWVRWLLRIKRTNKPRVKIRNEKIKQQEKPDVKSKKQQAKNLMETQWQMESSQGPSLGSLSQSLTFDLMT